ncbi:AAA family ATPase [Caulobacter sp. 602-2]|uniref:AAA family ATPase n=1 Tax=Caulobacter sp. 602-2 TaxID=2710887 RepID=A0A6G4QZW8_9CAUL|nr:AAA family ATPase [Caulobacter sp. 602-2]NGM51206.1 AAA family ATPase [Caulobacter sp. 602-2]
MLTRIEIDGFKTFEGFALDLQPFTAIVGPNASGKSNLFDALRFLSLLAQTDIRTAMQDLRGLPEELFRQTPSGNVDTMRFAVEVLLERTGTDAFGRTYVITAQRLRYELVLEMIRDADGYPRSVQVVNEHCRPLSRKEDTASYLAAIKPKYNSQSPFIRVSDDGEALWLRQDGFQKRGRPVSLSLVEASRTGLSTVTTAEFPHLYALRSALSAFRFLEINPKAARSSNDRFEDRTLKPDASNLAAVLADLKDETASDTRPDGVLADIAADLSSLIPSVCKLQVSNDAAQRQISFSLVFTDSLEFSSRVISDGTLRLLALLTILNDPRRRGTLCFEEPENGVHEGRVPMLIKFLRDAARIEPGSDTVPFQILINTHSPKVMSALEDSEIVAADGVSVIDPATRKKANRTRMRTGLGREMDMFDPERHLTRFEVDRLLQNATDAA